MQEMTPKHQPRIAIFGQYARYPWYEVVDAKEQPDLRWKCLSRERSCGRQPIIMKDFFTLLRGNLEDLYSLCFHPLGYIPIFFQH